MSLEDHLVFFKSDSLTILKQRCIIVIEVYVANSALFSQEVETYFYEALLKWKDLNLSENFSK